MFGRRLYVAQETKSIKVFWFSNVVIDNILTKVQ
jgi:hypothetical protein